MDIKRNFPIAGFSTFKIGGRAKFFCEVRNFREFLEAVAAAKKLKVPYKILAGGSNVVFPDGILDAFLIKIGGFSRPRIKISSNKIEVDAGAELMRLIQTAIKNGLAGLETLSGIPGTVGGAIVGNAGAYGNSISGCLERVLVWDPAQNKQFWLSNSQSRFRYRHSIFKEQPYVVLRAVFKFQPGNPSELKTISKNIIAARLRKYPTSLRCPGSFFKNVLVAETAPAALALIDKAKIIEGKIPSGYLLEQTGAKGLRLGGVRIADFHGNLLINDGRATAKEVKELAKILKDRVRKKFQIDLEEEIRYF